LTGGLRHVAWGRDEKVTVVTEVNVSNCETAREMRMWVCWGTTAVVRISVAML